MNRLDEKKINEIRTKVMEGFMNKWKYILPHGKKINHIETVF